MKLLPIYAALILTTATTAQVRAQDDLDNLTKAAATPAPAAAATPKPTPQVQQPRAVTTAATRSTPAPAAVAPRVESVREQLAHGRFIAEGDLASMAGQKVAPNVFLTGTYKATGAKPGGRYEFTTAAGAGLLTVRGSTRLLIRYPVAPDAKAINPGNASRWEKAGPLRIEKVEKTAAGVTAYATDVTP